MGRPRRTARGTDSPAVTKAKQIKKKYSPSKPLRARRALLAIEQDKVSIKKASEMFDLFYGYFYRTLSGKVDIDNRKGPATVFSRMEEENMAIWLKEMAERGMGLKPYEFMDFI
ncbi:hypothetical protein DPMN_160173 [Dreissena polymorpha]|uniref:Uncharacterized protein n=1 Tax=Dreissena polymorpha TaxID=45954 RepID=A0A9D4ELT1_DREPO|nr:hypothetical protein DPMN_160173 [Dreissena polymorpha]